MNFPPNPQATRTIILRFIPVSIIRYNTTYPCIVHCRNVHSSTRSWHECPDVFASLSPPRTLPSWPSLVFRGGDELGQTEEPPHHCCHPHRIGCCRLLALPHEFFLRTGSAWSIHLHSSLVHGLVPLTNTVQDCMKLPSTPFYPKWCAYSICGTRACGAIRTCAGDCELLNLDNDINYKVSVIIVLLWSLWGCWRRNAVEDASDLRYYK